MRNTFLQVSCLVLSFLFLAACSSNQPEVAESVSTPAASMGSAHQQQVNKVADARNAPGAIQAELIQPPALVPAVEAPRVAPEPELMYVKDVRIIMHTSKGDIEATLFATKTPVTVANFLNLAQRGYYDGLTFHRVIPDFMIQGGDPTASGSGGPGYQFEDEFHAALRHNRGGLFSMANSGPGTNGSQFFITHNETPWLDGKHSIFGKVTKGQRVVDSINQGATINSIEILDSTDALFTEQQERLVRWNGVLSAKGF